MTAATEPRTIDAALERFKLVDGIGDGETTACVMTLVSWVAGEAWTDTPECANPLLSRLAVRANDHPDTTSADRADIVRAGEVGLLDTWWVPYEVVVAGVALVPQGTPVLAECLGVLDWVRWWKETVPRVRPVLSGADLRGADLRGADLRDADLRDAALSGADLRDADLSGADLRDAWGNAGTLGLLPVWKVGDTGRIVRQGDK